MVARRLRSTAITAANDMAPMASTTVKMTRDTVQPRKGVSAVRKVSARSRGVFGPWNASLTTSIVSASTQST